jgi:DNA polymerase I-like protein with 3'-5' exonuclease and polymerase domains
VLNVHDELVVECFEEDQDDVKAILKYAMEETCTLPGVALVAIPVVAKNLRDLK